MVKFYYNKATYAYLYKEDTETWAQGDSDSKELAVYFGSAAGDPLVFTNGFTPSTIYNQSCEVIIVRPDGETSAALTLSAQPEGYYKLLIDEWITLAEGTVELFVRLKTASTTTAYGKATKAVAAGAPPEDPTLYVSQAQLDATEAALADAVLETATKIAISRIMTTTAEGTPDYLDTIYSTGKTDELLAVENLNTETHKARTDNPHSVTKSQVGLGSADNTSDADKPVSTAQSAALGLKENVSNKKTAWNTTPNDTSYPSEKLVKDNLNLKVDKAMTLLGLDLANDIPRSEFVAALGNASSALQGLMSPTDKDRLDALYALLGAEADADTVVNTINELLAVLVNYPEGVDLVTALAGKVDKVTGKGLSTNDYTDADELKVSHLPANFTTFMGDYYTKDEVLVLLDQLTTAYGLTETAISELAHNGTVALSTLTTYDYITLYLKHTDTHFIFDGKLIDPNIFNASGDLIQLNSFEGGIQHSYGVLTYNGMNLVFTASDTVDTLIVKGYKKEAITDLLVESEHSGTNYLDGNASVHADTEDLDVAIKGVVDDLADVVNGTTPILVTHSGTNYLDEVTDVKEAEIALDTAIKANADAIDAVEADMALFVSASYSDVTQDITFTLQNGTTVAVPIDDLVSGLASEDWVALNYVAKTQIVNDLTTGGEIDVLSANQGKVLQDTKEALTNKAVDFSVVDDTKYPTTKAVKDLVDATVGNIDAILDSILGV